MKKNLFLSFLMLCVAQMGMAQTQQMWWGYSGADETRGSLGTSKPETFDVAILIPSGQPMVSNSTIKSVRIYLRSTDNLASLKLWITRNLPGNTTIPDYIQNVDLSQLQGGDEKAYNLGLPNEIELATPYEVGGDSVYVGYSLTVTDTTTQAGKYPIITTSGGSDNTLYIRTSETVPVWSNSLERSKLAMQLLIEGDLRMNYVTTTDFVEQAVALGDSVSLPVTIVNGGKEAVESIAYTVAAADGQPSEELTVSISPALAYGARTVVMIPVAADAQTGITTRTVTITGVNGQPNEAEAVAQGTLRTVEEVKTFARTVLVETFATESTPNWPIATQGFYNMLTMYPELESRVAIVSHHAGYYDDYLTTEADNEYEWLYGREGYVFTPAFMWDRYVSPTSNSYTPLVVSPATVNQQKRKIDERLAVPSSADLQLTTTLSEDQTQLTVEASCERTRNFASTPIRLTLMLTEDNLEAKEQVGVAEGETFVHRHTFRAANATWGEPLEWNGDQATLSYTFTLDPAWKLDDLQVVGFVSAYDDQSPINCAVEQAAVGSITGGDSGVRSVEQKVDGAQAVYDLQGRRVGSSRANLTTGIYIVGGKKHAVK